MEKNYGEAIERLKKQQVELVDPLIVEVAQRLKVEKELRDENTELRKNLKLVHSIVRTPKLSDLFHKKEKERLNQVEIAKADDDAFHKLKKSYNINDPSAASQFVNKCVADVNRLLESKDNEPRESPTNKKESKNKNVKLPKSPTLKKRLITSTVPKKNFVQALLHHGRTSSTMGM